MNEIEQLLSSVIRAIVAYPDDVELHTEVGADEYGELTTIFVKVNNADVGLCIGEGGKNAESIRRLVSLAAHRQSGKRVYTKIDAPRIPKNHFALAAKVA